MFYKSNVTLFTNCEIDLPLFLFKLDIFITLILKWFTNLTKFGNGTSCGNLRPWRWSQVNRCVTSTLMSRMSLICFYTLHFLSTLDGRAKYSFAFAADVVVLYRSRDFDDENLR